MLRNFKKNRLDLLKLFFMIVVAVLSFQSNFFRFADETFFEEFDKGSQALVLGAITADRLSLDKYGAHLGFSSIGGPFRYPEKVLDAYPVFAGKVADEDVSFSPYTSQYGIQGPVFSAIYSLFSLKTYSALQLFNSVAFALVVSLLTLLYCKIYNFRFGIIFFAVMVSSPWVISFARNLYWVPVLWFLPALFSALAYRAEVRARKLIYLVLVGIAVFLKSLAGYEYLSTITLFACSVFVVAPFFDGRVREYRQPFLFSGFVFAACVLGFFCALLLHAGMRGETIVTGLQNIFEQDVKRRTYGDPLNVNELINDSLRSSPVDVLRIYINNWNTSLFAYLPGATFKLMLVFAMIGFLYTSITRKALDARSAVLFVFFLAVPTSWYILAKAHSYIHTQLSFVLWYFGFVQALLYVCLSYAVLFFKDCYRSFREWSIYKSLLIAVAVVGVAALAVLLVSKKQDEVFEVELLKLVADNGVNMKADNGLNVKLTKSGELAFYAENCKRLDLNEKFYLHAYKSGFPAVEGNYTNLAFEWKFFELPAPMWPFKYSKSCIAIVKLPSHGIRKLDFGQYSVVDGAFHIAWQDSLVLEQQEQANEITANDVSDANWKHGVSLNRFFVNNDFANRKLLAVGTYLKFSGSGLRRVSALEYTQYYINVTVEGQPLNALLDGYPNIISVQP